MESYHESDGLMHDTRTLAWLALEGYQDASSQLADDYAVGDTGDTTYFHFEGDDKPYVGGTDEST